MASRCGMGVVIEGRGAQAGAVRPTAAPTKGMVDVDRGTAAEEERDPRASNLALLVKRATVLADSSFPHTPGGEV